MKAGFCRSIETDKGLMILPKSISFEKMDNLEFEDLYFFRYLNEASPSDELPYLMSLLKDICLMVREPFLHSDTSCFMASLSWKSLKRNSVSIREE